MPQDVFVQAITPLSAPGKVQIGVRVGRLLVYMANRKRRRPSLDALGQAEALAVKAFGRHLPSRQVGEGPTASR